MDFRGALKQAEVSALEVLKVAEGRLEKAKAELATAGDAVKNYTGTDPAERAKLELFRDEKLRAMQNEDGRYQVAKDLADNLTIGYNTSEVIMARLTQTTSAKERVYQQAVSFFTTNAMRGATSHWGSRSSRIRKQASEMPASTATCSATRKRWFLLSPHSPTSQTSSDVKSNKADLSISPSSRPPLRG